MGMDRCETGGIAAKNKDTWRSVKEENMMGECVYCEDAGDVVGWGVTILVPQHQKLQLASLHSKRYL